MTMVSDDIGYSATSLGKKNFVQPAGLAKVLPASCRQFVRSRIVGFCRQDAGGAPNRYPAEAHQRHGENGVMELFPTSPACLSVHDARKLGTGAYGDPIELYVVCPGKHPPCRAVVPNGWQWSGSGALHPRL